MHTAAAPAGTEQSSPAAPAPLPCRPLGEQYAAMLTACSIGERIRDEGGHSLVVLNDASVMVRGGAGAKVL